MRIKKAVALTLCLIMCLGIVPFAAASEGAEAVASERPMPADLGAAVISAPVKGGERSHESVFNDPTTDTHFTFTDVGGYAWQDKSAETYVYIESGNAGHASSRSTLISDSVYMYAGEYVKFQYWYSTEENYDEFTFCANDETLLTESGESNGWKTYTYTIPYNGMYNFIWQYEKDGSQNSGSDCVRLAYITNSGHWNQYRERAALVPGGGGLLLSSPASGTVPFGVQPSDTSAHPLYLRSRNGGTANSIARVEATATVPDDPFETYYIAFDYAYETEAGADYFLFKIDGSLIMSRDGTDDYNWYHYSYQLTPGAHTFTWEYEKDSSVDGGRDCVCLDNFEIVGYNGAWDRYLGFERQEHPDNTAQLIFNTPAGSAGFNSTTQPALVSNNRFIDSSTSCFETTITMAQGEEFSFDYLVSSESYDKFYFMVDGETKLIVSGWEDIPQYHNYSFYAPETRTYVLRWEYRKNSSISRGFDLVYITNLLYNGSYYSDISAGDIDDMLNDEDTDLYLRFIGGAGVGGWFMPYVTPNWDGIVSSNKYYENSVCSFGSRGVYLNAGDKIGFEYRVSSEENNYDVFAFTANRDGEEVHHFTDSGDKNWDYHTYVCDQGGLYYFNWVYAKDESDDYYNDRVIIDNVKITRNEHALYYACNPDSDNPDDLVFDFYTGGDYPFVTEGDEDGRYYARSTNMGVSNSNSYLEAGAYLSSAGVRIEFDYNVSSESGYDYLAFYVNGTEVFRASGTDDPGWHTFTTEESYSGWTELKWIYHKDGSVNEGSDRAMIDNVCVVGGHVGLLGDADGSGTVNANDALMILRYALGIIPASALDLSVCDVDGNGTVNANDALLVLRAALGIITL